MLNVSVEFSWREQQSTFDGRVRPVRLPSVEFERGSVRRPVFQSDRKRKGGFEITQWYESCSKSLSHEGRFKQLGGKATGGYLHERHEHRFL